MCISMYLYVYIYIYIYVYAPKTFLETAILRAQERRSESPGAESGCTIRHVEQLGLSAPLHRALAALQPVLPSTTEAVILVRF